MPQTVNPLEYHYQTLLQLDYFILSANIAILGWTIVNTDWLPGGIFYILLISVFWASIVTSIIFGIIKQLYNGMLFGINHQYLRHGELASEIERLTVQGGDFMNQQTQEIVTADVFAQYAVDQRKEETVKKQAYSKYDRMAAFFGNASIVLTCFGLFLLALTKISTL